jgi:hypothetical protein
MQYVDTTNQTLRNRFDNYLSIFKHSSGDNTRCIKYFNSSGHSIENIKIIIIKTKYCNDQNHKLTNKQYYV